MKCQICGSRLLFKMIARRGNLQVRTVEGEVGEWLVLLGPAMPPLKDTLRLLRSRPDMRLASHLLSCACLSTGSLSSSAAVGRLSASLFRQAVTMLSSACAHILITTIALHLPGIRAYRQQLPEFSPSMLLFSRRTAEAKTGSH